MQTNIIFTKTEQKQTIKNNINMKTIKYKNHIITLNFSGWYTAQTSRYGIAKADTLKGIKQLINNSIALN